MKIKRGDYTFSAKDTRIHEWAIVIGKVKSPLARVTYEEFCRQVPYDPKSPPLLASPYLYYDSNDGLFATFYPPADKEYELVQLDKE